MCLCGGKNARVGKRCWRRATNDFLYCFKPFKLYSSQLMCHMSILRTAERYKIGHKRVQRR